MPAPDAYARLRARILQICQSAGDERRLRQQIVEELCLAVGFDAYVWLLTDPATSVGASPLADVPWLSELPRHIRLKYQPRVEAKSVLAGLTRGFEEGGHGSCGALRMPDVLAHR